MPNFNDMLQVYLVPFAIAVPIGLLLIFFGLRRGNRDQDADIPDIVPEPRRNPTPAPAAAPVVAPATDLDLQAPAARTEAPPSHGVSVSPGGARELPLPQHEKTQVFRREDFAATQPPSMLPDEAPAPRSPARLLVVDDSAVPRAKLKKLFEGAGYEVETASDGLEALDVMAKSARFHVIITDLEMPNLDGFGLIEATQGSLETEDIPIIAITGHDEMQARVHNIQGLFGIFKKPWNDRDLLKRVEVLAAMRKN